MAWWNDLKGADRDAAAALIQLFESYGLGTLAPKIVGYVQQGYGADTIALLLQETKEYKERFKANESRLKAGLPVLTPAEYLQVEAGYRQALQAAGLPKNFYDSPEDFHNFIGLDIAPDEIKERATIASDLINKLDPLQVKIVEERLGLSKGDMAAYFLDPKKALPILDKEYKTTLLGAERERAGFGYNQGSADQLYSYDITVDQARQGYGQIGEMFPTFDKLGDIDGQDYTVSDAEEEVFGSSGDAANKRKKLASAERGRFSGSAGTGSQTLADRDKFNY